MPRLQDVELFKKDLAKLTREAEVLERWGEEPEDIAPPPASAASTGAAPAAPGPAAPAPKAGKVPAPAPKAAKAPAPEPPTDELPPDFADLLDNMPTGETAAGEGASSSYEDELAALLAPGGEAEPEEGGTAEEPSAKGALADLNLDFDLGAAAPEEAPELPEEPVEAAPEPEPAAEGFEFSMPEFDEHAALPEEAQAEPGASGEPEAVDFSTLPGESAEAPAPEELAEVPEAPAVQAAGPEAAEFSIPDFDLVEEGSPAPVEAPAPEPTLGAGPASSGLDADAFETFSFEEPGGGAGLGETGFGLPPASFEGPGGRDLDTEIASLSEEAPVADTFKLDQDWGDFAALAGGAETARQAPPRPSPSRARAAPAPAEKTRPVALSEAQVDRLQDALLSFPLNLRVAVEDILANAKGSDAQQSRLVWQMVEGAPVEEVALLAGRVLKRRIAIPKGMEKRSGAALEARKGTLAYAMVHTFLPLMRITLLVLVAAASVGYLGWRFVYVPLVADSLYREGYRRIAEERFPEAEDDFAKATRLREFVAWYYRYAEAYAARRQYILAENKYSSLVAAHPKEKKGILDWARLEKDQLKFEEAVDVLKGAPSGSNPEYARGKTGLLSWDYFDEAGLLLLGDVYLDWAEESPKRYQDARYTYATLIERYGDKDLYLGRMLLYFIRTDKRNEVLDLKKHFLSDPRGDALGPEVLAELGGYLIDKGLLEDVRDILLRAAKKGPSVPEAHYNLARYFRGAGQPEEERKALDNAVASFSALPGLGGKRSGMFIDSLVWRGRLLEAAKEWVGAERDFAQAAAEYEKALELRRVTRNGRFGEAYAGLADVAYLQRDDLASALALYERAEANGYATQDSSYRRGNALYRSGKFPEALEQFYRAGAAGPGSPYLSYAFGSAFMARGDWFAAEANFRKAADSMAKELEAVGEPMPQDRPSEIEILKLYLQAENNLGVALYRSAARAGDARRRNEAMAVLTRAARIYDQLAQAPEALERPEPRNLPLQNMNTLLQTGRADSLLAYATIEKDMRFPRRD
jgi:hypothetical protein